MTSSRPIVVVDARMVGSIGHGVARYVQLMAKGLSGIQSKAGLPYRLVFLTQPEIEIEGFDCETTDVPFLNPKELVAIPKILHRLNAAAYHSPSFASLLISPCPWVVTVHDLIHLHFGSVSQKLYYRTLLRRFIRKARAVVTVSEYSREEISRWAGVPREQIDVVWNAIMPGEAKDKPEVLEEWGLEAGRYFLCLSNIKPHKNLGLLAQAYEDYWQGSQTAAWPLVVTTEGLPAQAGLKQLGPQDEGRAQALLKGAGALIYPSLLEGFGRPPLEAAVEGVPTIVSDIPVHREALSFFPDDEVLWVPASFRDGWRQAMTDVVGGRLKRPSSSTREQILSRYSTERMGQDMDRIYRRVLKLEAV